MVLDVYLVPFGIFRQPYYSFTAFTGKISTPTYFE